jgi:hypothetical protein
MSYDFSDVTQLRNSLIELTKQMEEYEQTISEITPVAILLLRAIGGEFIIDQTDEDTSAYIKKIMDKEVGFRVEFIDGQEVVKVVLAENVPTE